MVNRGNATLRYTLHSSVLAVFELSTVYNEVKCFNSGIYYVARLVCVENKDSFTLKCVIKKKSTGVQKSSVSTSVSYKRVHCPNFGIYYAAYSFSVESMCNNIFKCPNK